MKDVDENYLKMVIGEKVEDVLALLTPDYFSRMLNNDNWTNLAIKLIENIINST